MGNDLANKILHDLDRFILPDLVWHLLYRVITITLRIGTKEVLLMDIHFFQGQHQEIKTPKRDLFSSLGHYNWCSSFIKN